MSYNFENIFTKIAYGATQQLASARSPSGCLPTYNLQRSYPCTGRGTRPHGQFRAGDGGLLHALNAKVFVESHIRAGERVGHLEERADQPRRESLPARGGQHSNVIQSKSGSGAYFLCNSLVHEGMRDNLSRAVTIREGEQPVAGVG